MILLSLSREDRRAIELSLSREGHRVILLPTQLVSRGEGRRAGQGLSESRADNHQGQDPDCQLTV